MPPVNSILKGRGHVQKPLNLKWHMSHKVSKFKGIPLDMANSDHKIDFHKFSLAPSDSPENSVQNSV